MSHVHEGPLAGYNSLTDSHLAGYFANGRMRRHLRKAGLVSRNGQIVSESTYRLNMSRREHKKHVKDMLAQAIVHKTLDMERARQAEIKKKLEEIAKIQLVRRVKASTARKGDEDVLPLLTPRSGSEQATPDPSPRAKRSKRSPSRKVTGSRKGGHEPNGDVLYLDDEGRPITPSNFGEQKKRQSSARSNIDGRHLHSLDSVALRKYAALVAQMETGSSLTSPYMMPQMPLPPRPPSSARTPRSFRRVQSATPRRNVTTDSRLAKLHRPETAKSHAGDMQTQCRVTLKYHGWALKLAREQVDTRQEVTIEQQHCGGNTLTVFRDKLEPGSKFQFISYRHRGYPFSLSLYVDGQIDSRISTCCEYRHSKGAKLGGAQGHFSLLAVSGAVPCYKCQVAKGVNQPSKAPRRKLKRPAEVKKEEVVVTGSRGEKEEEEEEDEEDLYAQEGFEDDDVYADDFDDSQASDKSKDSSSSSSPSDAESDSSKEEKKKKKKWKKKSTDDDSDDESEDDKVRYERKTDRGEREADKDEEDMRRASPRVRGSERRSPRVEVNGTGREIDDYSSDEDEDKKAKVISVEDEDDGDRDSNTKIRSRRRSSSSSSSSSPSSSAKSSSSPNQVAEKSKVKKKKMRDSERETAAGREAVVSVERLNAEETMEEDARAERERRNAKRIQEEQDMAEKEKERKEERKRKKKEEEEEERRRTEERRQEDLRRERQREEERREREREEEKRRQEERKRKEREEEEERIRRRKQEEEEEADPETRERKRLQAQRERDERIRLEQEERERKRREEEKEREEKWRKQEEHREEKRKRAAEERKRRREEEESGGGSSYRTDDESSVAYSTVSATSSAATTPRHQPSKQPIPEIQLPEEDKDNNDDDDDNVDDTPADLDPRPHSPLPPAAIYEPRRGRRRSQDDDVDDDRDRREDERDRERAVSPFPDAAVYDADWRKSRKQRLDKDGDEPDSSAQERSVSPFPEAAVYIPRPKRAREDESKKPESSTSDADDDDDEDDDDDNSGYSSERSLEHVHEAKQMYSKEARWADYESEGDEREKREEKVRAQTGKSKKLEEESSSEEEAEEEESEEVTSSSTTPRAGQEQQQQQQQQQAGGGGDNRGGRDDSGGGPPPTATSESDGENMHGGADPDNVAEQEEGGELLPLKTKARPAAKAHQGEITELIKEGDDSVDLSNVLLNKSQVYQLASQLEQSGQLKTVSLCNTGLDNNDIQRLTDALIASPSQPVMMNLSQNAVGEQGVTHILHLLKAKPTIKVLILQGNPLGDDGVKTLTAGLQDIHRQARVARKAMAMDSDDTMSISSSTSSIDPSMMAQRYVLQELDLTDTGLSDGGAADLSAMIAGNVYLEHVNLSQNPGITSDEGWKQVGEALARNRCIRSLTLDGNRLGNEGVAHIAKGLRINRVLRSLGLEDAGIGEDGGRSLIDMLKRNTSILELTLSPGNSVPSEMAGEIAKYVALNRTPFNI